MFCSIFGDCKDEQNFGLIPGIDKFGLSSQLSRGSDDEPERDVRAAYTQN